MLAKLRSDHAKIMPLLLVLASDMRRMHSGQKVDIRVVRDLVDYLRYYIDERHHPLEDLLYRFYLEKLGGTEPNHRLEPEHDKMANAAAEVSNTLNAVISGHVIERSMVLAKLERYVRQQRALIEQEERVIFPKIERFLTPEDWLEVERRVAEAGLNYRKHSEPAPYHFDDLSQHLLI